MLPRMYRRAPMDEARHAARDKTRTMSRQKRVSVTVESLEQRTLFAAWPSAPFDASDFQGVIYVNQKGNADLRGKAISSPGAVQGYEISFDDAGRLKIYTRGRIGTELAFYSGEGQPSRTNSALSGNSSINNIPIGPDKDTLYIAVRAQDPTATGTYSLFIRGVRQNVIRPLNAAPKRDSFSAETGITGLNDTDFYSFTTSVAGRWTLRVDPTDPNFNPTLMVFDSGGKPVVGSFTRPLDKGGDGVEEIYIADNLPANTTYYFRVDGVGDSTGFYRVYAKSSPLHSAASRRRHR